MFTCSRCAKANNIYATSCAHCGADLSPAPAQAAPTYHVREPCPKCAHARFLVISSVAIPDAADTWRVSYLPVLCGHVGDERESAGRFQAYVCLGCGYTQWYATDLQRLEQLAKKLHNAQVIEVPAPPAYR